MTDRLDQSRRIVALIDRFHDDPAAFHEHILGRPKFHGKQAEIANALVSHRIVVCPGAHSIGKSWSASSLVLWYALTRRPSKVILTSPSYGQLSGVLWEGLRAAYLGSRLPLGDPKAITRGGAPQTLTFGPEWFVRAVATDKGEKLSGYHAEHLMVIVDEASLVNDEIWQAIEGLGYDRLLILGNPIRSKCRFREYYKRAMAGTPGFKALRLTAYDSPHAGLTDDEIRERGLPRGLTSKTWIDGVRVMYGESSPYWKGRVEAEFPDSDELVAFLESWLDRCADEAIKPKELGRSRWIACDPAGGTGRDRSGILVRDENQVLALASDAGWDLGACAGRIAEQQRIYRVPSDHITYDAAGIGCGLDGHLARHGIHDAIPFKGAESGGTEWTNMRTAAAMSARQRLNPGLANHRPFYIPPDILAQLKPELIELKLMPDDGDAKKQRLEPKEELKKRLGRSPDLGDCFCLSFVAGSDLPGMPLVINEQEASYVDEPEPEILTSDQMSLRLAGIM